jgi:Tfp pilus assembly protein PilF
MFRLSAVGVLSGCMLFAQAADPQSSEQHLQQAISLHQKGDFDGAITEYRAYLKLRPDAVDARSNLGAALAHQGRYEEAITEYRRALEKHAGNPGVILNLGLAYYKTGQFTEAAREFTAARTLAPDQKQAVLLLADCRLRLGEYKDVIALLTPLEKTSPDDLAMVYMLGTALVRDQQPERGQVLIDRILKNGDSAEARLLLGTTKMMANDYAGARSDLERAVELNPNLPDVYSYYASALLRTGDTTGATEAFLKELATDPNDFNSNLQLGALLRQDEKLDPALAHLERALRSRPGDPGARFQIASVHLAMGKTGQAREELEQLVKESPQFPEAHVTLATIYYRLKRKADGDRERAIVQKLTSERQAKEPGAQAADGEATKNQP